MSYPTTQSLAAMKIRKCMLVDVCQLIGHPIRFSTIPSCHIKNSISYRKSSLRLLESTSMNRPADCISLCVLVVSCQRRNQALSLPDHPESSHQESNLIHQESSLFLPRTTSLNRPADCIWLCMLVGICQRRTQPSLQFDHNGASESKSKLTDR